MTLSVTGSKLHLLLNCVASLVLPGRDNPTDAAARGTALHRFVELVLTGTPRHEALETVPPQWRHTARGLDFDVYRQGRKLLAVERAYGIEVATGRVVHVGDRLGRNYPRQDGWIYLTTDAIWRDPSGMLVVQDLKTGWVRQAPAKRNPQLLAAAYAAAAHIGSDGLMILEIPYLDDDGELTFDRGMCDILDRDLFWSRVRERWLEAFKYAVTGDAPPVTYGEHCRWCPARMVSCPIQAGEAHDLARVEAMSLDGIRAAIQDDAVLLAWLDKCDRVDAVSSEIRAAIRDRLVERPAARPDGTAVGIVEKQTRKINGRVALPIVLARLDPDGREVLMWTALERGMNQGLLREVFGKATAQDMMEALKAAGAVEVGISRRVATIGNDTEEDAA